jgi:hypothetical protein
MVRDKTGISGIEQLVRKTGDNEKF